MGKKKTKDFPLGYATLLAALLTGIFGFFMRDQEIDEYCIIIQNDAKRVAIELDEILNFIEDTDNSKTTYMIYRDALKSYSKYSCTKVKEEQNVIKKSIQEAENLLK